jgi:cytochrome P450
MLLFPDVSRRVYEEILSVTDGTRLPRISDRASLPFTEAVWKESIRWHPFTPLGLHHASTEDEVINGYTIKAGTIININMGLVI